MANFNQVDPDHMGWRRSPPEMKWMIIILISKGRCNCHSIGLLEPFWKSVEIIIDQRLQSIEFHSCIHMFSSGRGTRMATMETKLAHQLAYMEHEPLYGIFIDLRKTYNAMN